MIDIDKLEHISSEEFGRNLDTIAARFMEWRAACDTHSEKQEGI